MRAVILNPTVKFIFAAGAAGGIMWKISNLMGSNNHYDHEMLGDGAKAPAAAKEAERCASRAATHLPVHPWPLLRSLVRLPLHPRAMRPALLVDNKARDSCLAARLVPSPPHVRRLFRRHSSSASKHDGQLHPEAQAMKQAA